MRVLDHKEGPLDGSLYATVTKNSAISQQKQAMTTALGSMHQSPQQHPASMASSTLDSMASTHLSQNSLYDQSQLDDILNELLNESKKLNTSVASSDSSSLQLSPGRGYGSITTNAGNSRTVVSWQTSNAGPVKAGTVTKHTVAQPSPNSRTESVYTVHREEYNSTNGNAPVPPKRSTVPRLPPNAFSYTGFDSKDGESSVKSSRHETITSTRHESLNSTPINVTPIPPQRSSSARHFSPSAYERIASPTFSTNARSSPGPSRLPYRIDYEINPDSDTSHGYESDSGLSNKSWLQQQQMKLMAKREGRHDWVGQHTVQEQQLVNELKAAQASLKRRTASESAEPSVFEQRVTQNHSFQVESSNVPRKRSVSPVRHSRPLTKTIPLQRSQSESGYEQYRSEKSYYVSGVERPAFTTHQTKYTFSISPPKTSGISTQQETVTAKPPPSPAFGRSAPTSPLLAQKAYNFENRQVFKESSESTEYKFENQQRAYSQQRRPQDDGVVEEEIVTLQPVGLYNLEYEDKQRTTAAAPPQPEEDDYVEEEVVTLQPIGTGLQSLEPEIEGVVTHGRPPTPSFPTTVSNDSFSPKTPYDNKSLSPNLRQQHSPQVQMSSLSRNGLTNKPQSREGSYDRFEVERKLEAQMIDMSPKQASQEQYANQQYNVQRSVSNQMSSNQQSPKRDAYGNQQYSMQRTTSSQMSTNQASPNQPGQEQYLNQQYNMQQRSAPNQMSSNEAHKIESSAFNRSGQEQFVAQQFNMQQRAAPNQMSSQETHKFDASPGFNRQGQEQYLNQQINMNQRMGGNQMSHGDQMQRMDVSPGQQRQMDSQQQYSVQRSMVTSSEQMQRATPVNVPQPQPQQAQVIANNSMDSSHTQQMNRNISANESYTMENGHMHQLSVDTSSQNYPGGYFPASPSVNSEGSQQFSPSIGGSTFSRSTLNTTGMTGQSSPATSTYHGQSHRGSFSSLADGIDVIHHTPRFVRDTSKMWYKPHISREEAITLLKDKSPGTFVVRDSNSFPGAFGLAVKVAQVPPNVQTKSGDPQAELVRHFLIEPTSKGVKLKGCSNEPVFGSLAALVYQHSITPLALPCKLLLQEDSSTSGWDDVDGFSSQILQQGAACSVIYLNSIDTESLTGPEAVSKAVKETLAMKPPPKTTIVHFKVASQGITLTDNKRKLFFRRHYPISTVTFCGMDADDRHWTQVNADTGMPMNARCFGFVARKQGSATDNACHIFAEVEPEQPASAIVNFVTKVLIGQSPK